MEKAACTLSNRKINSCSYSSSAISAFNFRGRILRKDLYYLTNAVNERFGINSLIL